MIDIHQRYPEMRTPSDDKDHVFARFKSDKLAAADRRETLTIPRRAGASGSRSVEVVHVRSGGTIQDRSRRSNASARGPSWGGVFAATLAAATAPVPAELVASEPVQSIADLPPTQCSNQADVEPAQSAEGVRPSAPVERPVAASRSRKPGGAPKRFADPFDANDDGANRMRCGYAIASAREKRGLMTCAECG